jgi:hypothetical protein
MTFLALFALDQIKDFALQGLYKNVKKFYNCETDLRVWERHSSVPILGWIVRRQLKPETKYKKLASDRAIKATRWFVNTSTFEDAVRLGMQNLKLRPGKPPAAKPSGFHCKVIC